MDYVKYITADGVTKQVKDPEAAAASNLAPDYGTLTFPVAVGTKCTNNGVLYRCKTAISAREAFTPAHWEVISVYADLQAHFPDTGKLVAGTGTASANYAAAVGQGTSATQQGAHAEGIGGTASGAASHAEGSSSTASGAASHAEGDGTTASGAASHAEGSSTEARGDYAHTEGNSTVADGEAAHAEGDSTGAKGDASHASGEGTVANRKAQFVFGRYNVGEQTSTSLAQQYGDYVEIVGNGDVDTRSNARTLDWNGNEELAGDLTINKGKTGEKKIGTELTKKVNRTSVTTVKTAYSEDGTVTIDDALDEPAKLTLSLEPKQDLHGYKHPWVGGAGKNLLRMILTEIKAANSGWSWNGNTATRNGVSIVVQTDADSNVLGYSVSGTASDSAWFIFRRFGSNEILVDGSLKFGGYLSEDGNVSTKFGYQLYFNNNNGNNVIWVSKSGYSAIRNSITEGDTGANYASFVIRQGATVSNLIIQPMILLSEETDYTFEPYSNICPIEGYDTVWVTATGKNVLNMVMLPRTSNGISFEPQDNGLVKLSGTSTAFASRNSELFTLPVGKYQVVSEYRINGKSIGYDATCDIVIRLEGASTNLVANFGTFEVSDPNQKYFLRIGLSMGKTVPANYEAGAMICKADNVATAYEPFGSTTTLPISASAGSTVYGGTVTVNEDGSGTVVVDRAKAVITNTTSGLQYDGNNRLYIPLSGMAGIKGATSSSVLSDATSNQFVCVTTNETYNNSKEGFAVAPSGACYLYCSQFTSLDAWKTHLSVNNLEIEGALATPQSYPLTASQIQTLLGTNHVWTDSGCEFTLDYRTDKYGKLDEVYSAFPEGSVGPDDVVTITDGADGIPVKSLSVAIEPKQDLHGYDKPWVGGAGNNLLQSALVPKAENGITFTNLEDGSLKVNGTATANAYYYFYTDGMTLKPGTYTRMARFNDGSSTGTIKLQCRIGSAAGADLFGTSAVAQSATISEDTTIVVRLGISSGTTMNNVIVYPMIVSGTYTTDTFPEWEPYENICPISGWDVVNVTRCGKNLADFVQNMGIQQDGTVVMHNGRIATVNPIPIRSGSLYRFVTGNTSVLGILSVFKGNTLVRRIANVYTNTILDTSGGDRFYFCCYDTPSMTIETAKAMIVDSSEADTSYEPYRSIALPISLSRAGTVYGGTLDVGTGLMTVDRGITTLADKTFGSRQSSILPAGGFCIIDGFTDWIDSSRPVISDMLYGVVFNDRGADGTISPINATLSAVKQLALFTTKSKEDAIATYGNATIIYTLATPITYQLSPHELTTLLGTNNVWSDAGQVTVEYRADPKLYIAKHEMSAEDRQDITDIKAHFPDTGRFVTGICTASADYAAAVGNSTTASGFGATAQGSHTLASGMNSHAEGSDTQAIAGNSHAEGNGAVASGSGSHAEGKSSQASKIASHAEGNSTAASGNYSHAEGSDTVASGSCSHAEGYSTTASKDYTHAEGCETTASGSYAHAEGLGTVANHASQHVFGAYNVADDSSAAATSRGNFAEIVGNGANSHNLSNARTLDWSGNEVLAGGLTVNKISQVSAQTRTEDGYTIKTIRLEGDELELWRMEEIPGTGILDNTVTLRYSDLFNMLQMLNYYRSITPFTAAEMEQLRNLIAGSGGEVPVEIPTETAGDGEEPASGDGLEEEPAVIP